MVKIMDGFSNSVIRNTISEIRKQNNISIESISDEVERDFIEKFENNYFKDKTIHIEDIIKYARILGYDVKLSFTNQSNDKSYNVALDSIELHKST